MTPSDLRKLLIDRNLSEAEIGRRLGVTRQAVNHAFRWRNRTPWLRRGIAKELDIPYLLAWGEEDPATEFRPRGRPHSRRPVDVSTGTDVPVRRARAAG